MLPRPNTKFRGKPSPFGHETDVPARVSVPASPENPDPKNRFFGPDDVHICYRGVTQSFVQNRLRLVVKRAYTARGRVPRPREIPTRKTDFLVPTTFKHVTEAPRKVSCKTDSVWSSNGRTRLARRVPRPRKIPTRKTDFLVRTKFKHVTEASREVSCKTDSVRSSNGRSRRAGAYRHPRASPRKIPDPKSRFFFWNDVFLCSRGLVQNFGQNRPRLGLLPKIMRAQKINVCSCHLPFCA